MLQFIVVGIPKQSDCFLKRRERVELEWELRGGLDFELADVNGVAH